MAIVATDPSPIAEADNVDRTAYTTTGTAGANGKLYLVTVVNSKASAPDTPTLTHAGGLTCVQVATVAASNFRTTLFRALETTGVTAATFTADFAGATQIGCIIVVDELDGVDTGGVDGADAVVQSATNQQNTQTSSSVTLAAFADATNNAAFGCIGINSNVAVGHEAGYTELADLGHSAPTRAAQTQFLLGEDLAVTTTFTTSSYAAIAAEVKAAAAGAPQNVSITNAAETDTAQALAFTKTIFKTLSPAPETNTAQALTFTKTIFKTLTPAAETDTAVALSIQGAAAPALRARTLTGVGL